MAEQILNQPGGIAAQSTPGVAAPAAAAQAIDLMTPQQVAQMLGVSESDVLSSLACARPAGNHRANGCARMARIDRQARRCELVANRRREIQEPDGGRALGEG